MIRSYRNKNLEKLMMRGTGVRLQQKHVPQLRRILTSLNESSEPRDIIYLSIRAKVITGQFGSMEIGASLLSYKPMVTSLMLTTGIITRHF